jgi:multimeric flavodoxin WrbA
VAEGKWGDLMGKKILVIEGSPRKGGNTDLLSDEFIRGAKEAGHDVEKVYLRGMKQSKQKLSLKKRDGIWFITRSVASTYN